MGLAQALGVRTVVLCDLSAEMARKCRELRPDEVWQVAAEDLPATDLRFDVVICLWNVLGHVASRAGRVRALARIKDVLADGGTVFLDVNNRHNASAYGASTVAGRVVLDLLKPDERRGDASFAWKIGDRVFPAMGHLFTPMEIAGIIRDSGLVVKKRVSVNYATGKLYASLYMGQLLFVLGKSRGMHADGSKE